MNTRTLLLASLVFALLQGPLFPPVLAEGVLLVLFVLSKKPQTVAFPIFLSGLLFDLLQSQTLGVTSLLFLLFAAVIIIAREQIPVQKSSIAALLVFAFSLLRGLIVFAQISFVSSFIAGLFAFLILRFVWRPTGELLEIKRV